MVHLLGSIVEIVRYCPDRPKLLNLTWLRNPTVAQIAILRGLV
jgi:hypothetical protein